MERGILVNSDDQAGRPDYRRVGGVDDEGLGAYMRQVGALPRLNAEEEAYHTQAFYDARDELGALLSHFPRVLSSRIAACRMSEVSERQPPPDSSLDAKRQRVLSLLEAVERISEELERIAGDDGLEACTRRALLHNSLERLLAPFLFGGGFYQECMAELTACAEGQSDERVAAELLLPAPEFAAMLPALRQAWERVEQVRDILVESNLRLVVSVARKYTVHGMSFMDLVQEGNLGLLQAVDRYEPQRGHRFSTYAVWWIRQAITSAVTSHSRTIRIPANMANAIRRIQRAEEALLQELGAEADAEQIADYLDMEPEKVSALRKMKRQTISLQSTVGPDEEKTLTEILVDQKVSTPDEVAGERLLSETIDEVLRTLSDRERRIIIARFGLNGHKVLTLEELSGQFSVTHERIRQIEVAALKKLRHPSRRKFFDGYFS